VMAEAIAFYTIAAFILGFAVLVVTTKDTVHSVLFLVLDFLFVAALYVLLNAPFLAALQVLVYAGGIVVLLLLWFGVPALTSRSPFVSASNAFGSGRRLKSNRVFGTVDRFLDLYAAPLEIDNFIYRRCPAVNRDQKFRGKLLEAAVDTFTAQAVAFFHPQRQK